MTQLTRYKKINEYLTRCGLVQNPRARAGESVALAQAYGSVMFSP